MRNVTISGRDILVDGQPIRILSGAVHYFRILPELWEDRLLKARALGLNTIETYVPWNLHEPAPGKFNFSGLADVEKFIELVDRLGFMVIVRPSPYICAEWEFGGLPAWLLTIPGLRLRCYNQPYLDAIRAYFDELLPRLKKFQYPNG
ncbi:MAG: beta-galactosidase, partial [Victivallales bacterium]|nr:beta-galactosidase [Victivallales bacterium]